MSQKSVDSLIEAEVQMPHRSTKKSKTPHDYTGRSMPNKIQWRMDVFSFKYQSQELLVVANILDYCELTVLSYVATTGELYKNIKKILMLKAVANRYEKLCPLSNTVVILLDPCQNFGSTDMAFSAKTIGLRIEILRFARPLVQKQIINLFLNFFAALCRKTVHCLFKFCLETFPKMGCKL